MKVLGSRESWKFNRGGTCDRTDDSETVQGGSKTYRHEGGIESRGLRSEDRECTECDDDIFTNNFFTYLLTSESGLSSYPYSFRPRIIVTL